MRSLDQLRAEADRESDRFVESYRTVRRRLAPRKLVDQMVHRMDPHFRMLHRVEDKIRRNPLVAIIFLLATAVIAKNTLNGRTDRREIKPRTLSANGKLETEKEIDYGYSTQERH